MIFSKILTVSISADCINGANWAKVMRADERI
jgi:hypothetical protein